MKIGEDFPFLNAIQKDSFCGIDPKRFLISPYLFLTYSISFSGQSFPPLLFLSAPYFTSHILLAEPL
jgi:hypothetical protein